MQQGKVLYVGSSNFAGWHIVKANERAARRNFLGLVSEQSLYNLNARMIELEVLPACIDYGVGVIPWSPLGGGILGGALQKVTDGRRGEERMQQQVERMRPTLEVWEKLCADRGEPPANVALAWLLRNPAVTAPIIGPRTVEQLDGAIGALDVLLDDEVVAELDRISPAPVVPLPRPTPGEPAPARGHPTGRDESLTRRAPPRTGRPLRIALVASRRPRSGSAWPKSTPQEWPDSRPTACDIVSIVGVCAGSKRAVFEIRPNPSSRFAGSAAKPDAGRGASVPCRRGEMKQGERLSVAVDCRVEPGMRSLGLGKSESSSPTLPERERSLLRRWPSRPPDHAATRVGSPPSRT